MIEWTPAWEAFNTPENDFYGLLSPEQLVEACGEGGYGRLPKSSRPMDVILFGIRLPIKVQQGSQASLGVEVWNSAFLSGCQRAVRPLVEFRWGNEAFSRG